MGPGTPCTRRGFLLVTAAGLLALSGCASEAVPPPAGPAPGLRMPAEGDPHEATWMCWPSRTDVWGGDLPAVQATIAEIALAIAAFEPVRMLARPQEAARVRARLRGGDVEVLEGPVDDLWARDTLPCFLVGGDETGAPGLAAGRFRFNGWGGKQVHDGDVRLAGLVADTLGIPLVESGLTGEGGGIEVDGTGIVLAARSSWVNPNRNPGMSADDVAAALARVLGAEAVVWVDGLAGEDITDGHIDTLARFASPGVVAVDVPSAPDPGDVWSRTAVRTRSRLASIGPREGGPFDLVELVQPASPRSSDDAFLSSYLNYYVCNGAVIAPRFGDATADRAASATLAELHPGREVVQLDIDPVAAGGGGIHCATQQQPAV